MLSLSSQLSIAAVVLLVIYLFRKLYVKRFEQFSGFPQHPSSLLLGHLAVVDEYVKKHEPKAHTDMAFAAMHRALGRPPVMFVDLRPAASPMLVIGSYEAAEQLVKTSDQWPYTPHKSPDIWKNLEYLTGPTSIIAAKDEEWRSLRKRFNPGFTTQNLMELLPAILDKVSEFVGHLERHARTREEVEFQMYATDLTFDIIGRVALDIELERAETTSHEANECFSRTDHHLQR